MQHYFDKEEHNVQTDLPHGSSKTNTWPRKHTKESVKIAIKESISMPKDVVNDLFQHVRGAREVKCTSDFPISHQQVKDLWRNKCPEDDTIKLIETCKNEMNIEKAFIRSTLLLHQRMLYLLHQINN